MCRASSLIRLLFKKHLMNDFVKRFAVGIATTGMVLGTIDDAPREHRRWSSGVSVMVFWVDLCTVVCTERHEDPT